MLKGTMIMRKLFAVAMALAFTGVVAVSIANGSILSNDKPSPRTELPNDGHSVDPRDYMLARHGFQRGMNGRAVGATASGQKQFVYESPQWRCVADENGGGICADPPMVAAGRSFSLELCVPGLSADQVRVRGVVPTSIHEVTVTTATATRTFPAERGTIAFEVPRAEVDGEISLKWSTGGASVTLPARFAASDCGS